MERHKELRDKTIRVAAVYLRPSNGDHVHGTRSRPIDVLHDCRYFVSRGSAKADHWFRGSLHKTSRFRVEFLSVQSVEIVVQAT